MDPWMIGLIGIIVLLCLIAMRVHVAFALATVGICGYFAILGWEATAGLLTIEPYSFTANFVLTTIPLFLLMGYFAHHAGLTQNVYQTTRLWLSRVPGGLAIASVAGCALFGAACGSSLATAAMMGRAAIPEMTKHKYNKGLAAGCVAAGGTLGSLIPPSILLVLFGAMTETSISKLLIAGFIPGILSALMYMAVIFFRTLKNPELAPPVTVKVTWKERFISLNGAWGILALFVLVIGGIYFGFFTPTEAGAVGAFGAFLIALLNKRLSWENFVASLSDTVRSTAQIFAIAVGAVLFTKFIAVSNLSDVACDFIVNLKMNPVLIIAGLSLLFVFLGMFLDSIGVMLLTLPIVFPVIVNMGLQPIWFGIIMIKYLEIGLVTPPVGMNVYVIKGVVGEKIALEDIFRGIWWFVGADALTLAILILFPGITLFLPNIMH